MSSMEQVIVILGHDEEGRPISSIGTIPTKGFPKLRQSFRLNETHVSPVLIN